LVCEKEFSDELLHKLADVWSKNAVDTETAPLAVPSFETNNQDQAWLIQSNVQFCASVYPAVAIDHPDAAVMTILGPYLRDGFLHQAIREQGGAYGGGAGYDANACAFRFFSYRDPRMSETFADFERSIDWLMNHDAKPHQIEEAILGVISSMDKPGSPAGEAITSCYANFHKRGRAFRQAFRQRILEVSIEDLRRVTAQYLVDQTPSKSVVAPIARQNDLIDLGFDIQRL
jgi:Zn-dependent M16 (insulinase) family peptidase